MTLDDKPVTPAQARQKLQKGLEEYLAGNDTGPIVFRLKRTRKANETYPLKLTQQQRQTLLESTNLRRNLKRKIEQSDKGTQIVPVTNALLSSIKYDFGDGWEHEVLFEGCPTVDAKAKYPLCLEGKRACPPEDCGGVWGYCDFLEAICNPKHEEHAGMDRRSVRF